MRIAHATALLLVSAAAWACPARDPASGTTGTGKLPNLVLIIADDQGYADFGFMGSGIATPHIDQLAREGTVFERGYVPTPLCRPSLLTLVTGHYARTHGVTGNDPSPKLAPLGSAEHEALRAQLIERIDSMHTLPERLREGGYRTLQTGKWWEGGFERGGFDAGMTRGFPQPGGRHGDRGLRIGREGLEPIRRFLDASAGQNRPFFIWYAPFLPHEPHDPPARLLARYAGLGLPEPVVRYRAMCSWLDETVGELVAVLEQRSLRDDTLIVFVSDNGWIQDPSGPGFAPRSKQSFYEGGIRTPIVFSWPGQIAEARSDVPLSTVDIVPTLLEASGSAPAEDLPGRSLWPMLLSGEAPDPRPVFGEGYAHDIASLERVDESLLYRWCIDGRWKLVLTYDGTLGRDAKHHPRSERGPQLFDLRGDPGELVNQAAQRPQIVARLSHAISGWVAAEASRAPGG